MSGLFFDMTKIKNVYFHPKFENGTSNTNKMTDKPFMSPDELASLAAWVANILSGQAQDGLNKPSWIDNNTELVGAELYKKNNVWHYHCGPYAGATSCYSKTDASLNHNSGGAHSAAAYHYAKHNDVIVVLGYSKIHTPFPKATSRSNPLKYRIHTIDTAIPTAPPTAPPADQ